MIEPKHSTISITRQCELITLPRASYYRFTNGNNNTETAYNLELMRLIDEEYTRHPFYGSRKMCAYLNRQGYSVNRKRIQRLMQLMCLASVAPKPNTSKKHQAYKVYPYLLRNLIIDHANQVWCADITYIRMQGGFVYLVAIMDWNVHEITSAFPHKHYVTTGAIV